MSLQKRITTLIICLALLIAAFIVSPSAGNAVSLADKGDGADALVNNLEELKGVLDFTSETKQRNAVTPFAKTDDEAHTSCQFIERTILSLDSENKQSSHYSSDYKDSISGSSIHYYHSSGSTSKEKNSIDRTLQIYMTKDAQLYKSEGKILTTSESHNYNTEEYSPDKNNNNSRTSKKTVTRVVLDFKVQIYINQDKVFLFIERLDFTYYRLKEDLVSGDKEESDTPTDFDMNIFSNYCNRWIDCSSDTSAAFIFIEINNDNKAVLSKIGRLIQRSIDGDKIFTKNGNSYTMDKENMLRFFNINSYPDKDTSGDFVINLNNRSNPKIDMHYKVNYKDSYDSGGSSSTSRTATANITMTDFIEFKNIDNTVIKEFKEETVDIKDLMKEEG